MATFHSVASCPSLVGKSDLYAREGKSWYSPEAGAKTTGFVSLLWLISCITLGTRVKIHCALLALLLQQDLPPLGVCKEGKLTLLWSCKSGIKWKPKKKVEF